jgi:hypothetical protein
MIEYMLLVCWIPYTMHQICCVTEFLQQVAEKNLLRYDEIESSIAKLLGVDRVNLAA